MCPLLCPPKVCPEYHFNNSIFFIFRLFPPFITKHNIMHNKSLYRSNSGLLGLEFGIITDVAGTKFPSFHLMFMSYKTLGLLYILIIYSGISHFTSIEKPKTSTPSKPVVSSYSKPKPVADSYKKKEASPNMVTRKERLSKVLGMTYPPTRLGHYDPLAEAKKRMKERESEKLKESVEVAKGKKYQRF